MGGLLLARIARVGRKCMIESRPEYVLGMHRQVPPHREGKRVVRRVRHGRPPLICTYGVYVAIRLIIVGKATLRNIKQPQTLRGQTCQKVSADRPGGSMTVVAQFAVSLTGFLDANGEAVSPLPAFAHEREELATLYRAMVLTRTFDAKAIALQRTERLGTYASSLGQEAVAVGAAAAMQASDLLVPSFREHGAQLWRGVTLKELFLYWGGDERGNDFAGPRQDFPVCVPVGSHAPHAVGAALAFRLRGEKRAAVCMFGDGATSKGDVAEALNMAGVWKPPVVFVVSNNGWAISVPRAKQSAAAMLAQKAIAAGIAAEQVDGNDVIAVRFVVGRALERARAGGGPAVIEAITYRLSDHTGLLP